MNSWTDPRAAIALAMIALVGFAIHRRPEILSQWAEPRAAIAIALLVLFAAAYFTADEPDQMMKGALIAAFAAGYTYWIGSSRGSADKSRQIEQLINDQQRGKD